MTYGKPRDIKERAQMLSSQKKDRITVEDKAKVVAFVWGTEFVQFLAAVAVCCGRFGKIG